MLWRYFSFQILEWYSFQWVDEQKKDGRNNSCVAIENLTNKTKEEK